jgi:uncharacterized membrane protein YczE
MRRAFQLVGGLVLYGFSMVLLVQAGLGVMPWDVLHQGLALRTGWSLGTVVVLTGTAVLLLWWPLRQRPGPGTVANVVVIGVATDAFLRVVPPAEGVAAQVLFLAAGIGCNAVATAAYIGARLGPGPRDGLMTGLAGRTGWPIRLVRTGIEVVVVAVGWGLGGTVGIGTIAYALLIGPLVHPLLPRLDTGTTRTSAGTPAQGTPPQGTPAQGTPGVASGEPEVIG